MEQNIQELYKAFEAVINIESYNAHTFYIPTEFPVFMLPKSEFLKFKKTAPEGQTTEQYERQFFNGLLHKTVDEINSMTRYKILQLGFENFKTNSTWFILLCRAMVMQIAQMCYDGSYNERLTSASFSSANGNVGYAQNNDGFWYTAPFKLLRDLGLNNPFGAPSEFDPNDINWDFVATQDYVDQEIINLHQQINIQLADMEAEIGEINERTLSEIETLTVRVNDFYTELDAKKADKTQLATISDITTGQERVVKNLKFTGELATQTVNHNDDGSVDLHVNIAASAGTTGAFIIDTFENPVADDHLTQAPSFNIVKIFHDDIYSANYVPSSILPITYDDGTTALEGKHINPFMPEPVEFISRYVEPKKVVEPEPEKDPYRELSYDEYKEKRTKSVLEQLQEINKMLGGGK